jgi:alpha-L-rhamnosidase
MEKQPTKPPVRSSKTMASRRDVLKIAGFAVAAGATRSKAIDFTQDTSPPTGLTCEYLVDPLGVDTMHPRLSWMLGSAQRGARQTGYHILVAREAALLQPGKADVWDSGHIHSDQNVLADVPVKCAGLHRDNAQ